MYSLRHSVALNVLFIGEKTIILYIIPDSSEFASRDARLAEVEKMSGVGYDFHYRIRRRHL